MERYFDSLAAIVQQSLRGGERFTATFDAEDTDFVRLNRGKVRQPGTVSQRYLSVRLIEGTRHGEHTLSLSGDLGRDGAAVRDAVSSLRAALPDLADDPLLLLPSDVRGSRSVRDGALPPSEAVVDEVLRAADGADLVGIYAAGPVFRGFANSEGQRNWHVTTAFNLQWSLYHRADKAVKTGYAGFAWDPAVFGHKMANARERLALIGRPSRSLEPGKYRAYLTPSAMEEIAATLCWGGFSARALATKQSSLDKMQDGAALAPSVSLVEDTEGGVAPAFQADGFARPSRVPLIERGRLVGSLVSPRTAREFGLVENGANGAEMPESLAMAGGTLAEDDVLAALDTGLAVGNLHYLNYSDRPACRITGMTRFATFWVENGKVVAPVDVLRFDDTVYRLLGANLEALTTQTEFILDAGTYQSRQLASVRLPGALVKEMAFTL
ncbi:MAG TPA: metallopeptidase TldD-related protein [Casimicrobiaceae bacterium]|nr:metallopeptidase TldD-related protein [Casimicrobiaceae bacterium]